MKFSYLTLPNSIKTCGTLWSHLVILLTYNLFFQNFFFFCYEVLLHIYHFHQWGLIVQYSEGNELFQILLHAFVPHAFSPNPRTLNPDLLRAILPSHAFTCFSTSLSAVQNKFYTYYSFPSQFSSKKWGQIIWHILSCKLSGRKNRRLDRTVIYGAAVSLLNHLYSLYSAWFFQNDFPSVPAFRQIHSGVRLYTSNICFTRSRSRRQMLSNLTVIIYSFLQTLQVSFCW